MGPRGRRAPCERRLPARGRDPARSSPDAAPRYRRASRRANGAWSSGGSGFALEERDEAGDLVAQVAAVDDHVDGALLQQELRALEAFRKRLANGLLDHARTCETDQRAGLGDDDVADEGEARG